jgi:plastocyanin
MSYMKNNNRTYVVAIFTFLAVCTVYSIAYPDIATAQNQPVPDATSVYDSGEMVLGNNVKNLVILIPDEGHHGPGEEDEARFIAQPFVPQNAVVSPGTQVVWFNGDVGHIHNIVVTNADTSGLATGPSTTGINKTPLFNSGEFSELQASIPYTFSQVGEFDYIDTIDYEAGFRMTGKITVVDQENSAASTGTFDTVGALMIPSMDVQSVAASIKNAGFGIDSMHNFQDLRGGQPDTGDKQTLVIWTTNGMDLSEIGSRLQAVSEDLPYE